MMARDGYCISVRPLANKPGLEKKSGGGPTRRKKGLFVPLV